MFSFFFDAGVHALSICKFSQITKKVKPLVVIFGLFRAFSYKICEKSLILAPDPLSWEQFAPLFG